MPSDANATFGRHDRSELVLSNNRAETPLRIPLTVPGNPRRAWTMRCDSHVHVVGPAGIHPQVPTRTYLAEAAPLCRLCAIAAPRGIDRFVIVQPGFYGTDNTVLLENLDALGGRGRGVAVVDPDKIAKATLAAYAARDTRGLRLNLYSPKGNARTATAIGMRRWF